MSAVCEWTQVDVPSLVQRLGSHDPIERELSRKFLVAAGHEAVIPLLHRLKSQSEPICWEAAKALGEIRDPVAANGLAEALEHDRHSVRWLAAEGLAALGPEGLRQVLVALLTKSRSNWVREGAHHVISNFAHRTGWEFLLPLLMQFDGFEPAVMLPPAALRALHVLHNRTVVRDGMKPRPKKTILRPS